MATLPYVQSRVNGIKFPIAPAFRGILHRFDNPENKLVIARTSEGTANATATMSDKGVRAAQPDVEVQARVIPEPQAADTSGAPQISHAEPQAGTELPADREVSEATVEPEPSPTLQTVTSFEPAANPGAQAAPKRGRPAKAGAIPDLPTAVPTL